MTNELAALSKEQAILAAKLPELRQTEAEFAAKLHRLTVSRDGLEGEEQRIAETQEKLNGQLEHIAQDEIREKESVKDSLATIERLEQEKKLLEEEISGAADNIEELAPILQIKQSEDTLDAELVLEELMTGSQAERNADRLNFTREIEERRGANQNLEEQKVLLEDRLSTLEDNNFFIKACQTQKKAKRSRESNHHNASCI